MFSFIFSVLVVWVFTCVAIGLWDKDIEGTFRKPRYFYMTLIIVFTQDILGFNWIISWILVFAIMYAYDFWYKPMRNR